MSGPFIGYPSGWILASSTIPDAARSRRSWRPGSARRRLVLTGAEAAAGSRGSAARVASGRMPRAMQFLTMDQLPDFLMYELALARAGPWSGCDRGRRACRGNRGAEAPRRPFHQPLRRVVDRGDRPLARHDARSAAAHAALSRWVSSPSHDSQADAGQRGRLPRRAGRRRELLRRLPDQPLDRDPEHRLGARGRAPRVPVPPGRGRDRVGQRDHRRLAGGREGLHRHVRTWVQPHAGGGRLRAEGRRAVRLRERDARRTGDRHADHARPGRHHAGEVGEHRRLHADRLLSQRRR